MNLHGQFRFPFVDLAVVLAMVLLGCAVWLLAKVEPQVSNDRQEAQDLEEAFKRGRKMAATGSKVPERVSRESYALWQEARALQSEYSSVADRLEGELPELERMLSEAYSPKGGEEPAQRMRELSAWIEKQKDRATFDPFEGTSKELEERLARGRQPGTNGSPASARDLGSLMGGIEKTYERYLSNYNAVAKAARPVTSKKDEAAGAKPIASGREDAAAELGRLRSLASEARQEAEAIESWLKTEERAETASPTTKPQQALEEAFSRAASPGEFAQGLWRDTATAKPAGATVEVPPGGQLHQVQYVLLATLAALGVLLILDVYWRMVVQQRVVTEHRDEVSGLKEEHRKELRQLEQMAAQLAHEIRNRLTTINAWMFTFQRKLSEATPEHKETRVIRGEVQRINQILGEFIQLARPEVPRLARMKAEPLLKEIRELMPPQLQTPGVRLECHSEGQAEFQGDRRQLKEVLQNLVQNAAQSMSDRGRGAAGGEIILRSRDDTLPLKGTETKVVIIEVEDNGPGVRPELQGRLFEPFFSTKEQGTGLGLPICARIIDGHGGTLGFDTQVGRGTVFRIVLPAYEAGN
jgi:signal transduction histidine kinase